jgi:hypothetical protein
MCWLECLEIVSTVAAVTTFWTVLRIPVAWLV